MASNGVVSFRAGRGPSFILIGLAVIVIILFYSYWGVSSKNSKLLKDVSILQDRLRVLAERKLTADKKGSALLTQITQMQDENGKLLSEKDSKISDVIENLKSKDEELAALQNQEKVYQAELEKLRSQQNQTLSNMSALKGRADALIKKFDTFKYNQTALQKKIIRLVEEKTSYEEQLQKAKLELEKAQLDAAAKQETPVVNEPSVKVSSKAVVSSSSSKNSVGENKEDENKSGDEHPKLSEPSKSLNMDPARDSDQGSEENVANNELMVDKTENKDLQIPSKSDVNASESVVKKTEAESSKNESLERVIANEERAVEGIYNANEPKDRSHGLENDGGENEDGEDRETESKREVNSDDGDDDKSDELDDGMHLPQFQPARDLEYKGKQLLPRNAYSKSQDQPGRNPFVGPKFHIGSRDQMPGAHHDQEEDDNDHF